MECDNGKPRVLREGISHVFNTHKPILVVGFFIKITFKNTYENRTMVKYRTRYRNLEKEVSTQ